MQSPILENRIHDIKELIRIWNSFYSLLISGRLNETNKTEYEEQFIEIKTVIAEKHESLMAVVEDTDDKPIAQTILNTVKRTISLQDFARLSTIEINKIGIEWHNANILLHETLGALEYKREVLLKTGATGYYGKKVKTVVKKFIRNFLANPWVKIMAILAVLIAIGVVCFLNWSSIQASPVFQRLLKPVLKVFEKVFG